MSIRSWDRVALPPKHEYFTRTTSPATSKYDGAVPVRVVVWPEGAPDPSTVPQAGEHVVLDAQERWRQMDSPGRRKQRVWVVSNGIPYKRMDERWRLQLHRGTDQFDTVYPYLKDIIHPVPVANVPEKAYTETEIRAAVNEDFDTLLTLLDDARRTQYEMD